MRRLVPLILMALCARASADELYLRAFRAMRYPQSPQQAEFVREAVTEGWPHPNGDDAMRALGLLNAQAIAALRRAGDGAPRCFGYAQPASLEARLPQADLSVRLALVSLLEARRLAADGHALEAAELCVQTAALGQDAMRGGPLAARFAGGTILGLVADVLGDLALQIAEAERSRDTAVGERVVDKLAALERRAVPLADSMRAERDRLVAVFGAAADAMKTDPANGAAALADNGIAAEELAGAFRGLLGQPVEDWPLFEWLDELAQAAEGPLAELRGASVFDPGEDPLTQAAMDYLSAKLLAAEAGRAKLLAAQVALGVAEARLDGRDQRALGALLDGVLDPVPLDPFTGFPFRYNEVEGGFFVYSHGPGGEDDGARTDFSPGSKQGDLVVWTPRRSRFVWRGLAPALEEWRAAEEFEWMRWDTHRPRTVIVATQGQIVVGDARRASLRRYPRDMLAAEPFEARDMAFCPERAWLATSRGLFAFSPDSGRWARWPVGSLDAPDCLAVRVDHDATLSVLVGPPEEARAYMLDLGTQAWSVAASDVARIWIENLGL